MVCGPGSGRQVAAVSSWVVSSCSPAKSHRSCTLQVAPSKLHPPSCSHLKLASLQFARRRLHVIQVAPSSCTVKLHPPSCRLSSCTARLGRSGGPGGEPVRLPAVLRTLRGDAAGGEGEAVAGTAGVWGGSMRTWQDPGSSPLPERGCPAGARSSPSRGRRACGLAGRREARGVRGGAGERAGTAGGRRIRSDPGCLSGAHIPDACPGWAGGAYP